jgi:hypothetical protein
VKHVDIAQWAMGMEHTGPVKIDGRGELPNVPNGYNVPIDYEANQYLAREQRKGFETEVG